jgi:hypothetical protein
MRIRAADEEGAEMSTGQNGPLSRRVQARVMNVVNVPMRAMLGLPFATPAGGRLMLAFIVGRKTGRIYRQPLSYVRDGTTLLTPGGGKWKLNLSEEQPVRLRIRGRDQYARPELVREPAGVEALLDKIAAGNPMAGRFAAIPKTAEGRLDPERLALAVDHGFGVVRWHLDDPASSKSQ